MNEPLQGGGAQKEIDFLGMKTMFVGDPGDPYFADLQLHSAQNSVLLNVAGKLDLRDCAAIDVGANIGLTARLLRRLDTSTKLVLIEASPKAFGFLLRNAPAEPVLALNVAAGARNGAVDFIESDYLAGSFVSAARARLGKKIKMMSLDAIAARHHIDDIKLIKIDVEGYELDVLKGAKRIIAQWNPVFVMEFNSYAIAANRLISPMALLSHVTARFGKFYSCRGGQSAPISTDKDIRDFFYSNMCAQGCVEDIYFGGDFSL